MMATVPHAIGGREMTVGSVMGRAFAALGAAPVPFFGIGFLLVALPGTAVSLLSRSAMRVTAPSPGNPHALFDPATFLPALFGTLAVWWVLYMAAQAVLFRATIAAIDRRPATWRDHAVAGARALPGLLALSVLLTIAVWVGSILLFVPGIMLALIWSAAAPALVAERCGVFASLRRSRRLTKGARWRIFGLVLVVFAIYFMASSVVGAGSLAVTGFPRPGTPPPGPSAIATIVSAVVQTAFVAVWSAIQAALYVELRDWKDGPAGERLADIFA